jgi:hypothetical protein
VENVVVDVFPLALENYYAQDDTTMALQAAIGYGYHRLRLWAQAPKADTRPTVSNVLSWTNRIKSAAEYNRSLDHTTIYTETGTAAENFNVRPTQENAAQNCFERRLTVNDGYVLKDDSKGDTASCSVPSGLYFCGIDVCGVHSVLPGTTPSSSVDPSLTTQDYINKFYTRVVNEEPVLRDLASERPFNLQIPQLIQVQAPTQAQKHSQDSIDNTAAISVVGGRYVSKSSAILSLDSKPIASHLKSLLQNNPLDAAIFNTPARNPRRNKHLAGGK